MYLACAEDVGYVSGLYFEDARVVTPAPAALDALLAQSVWTISLEQLRNAGFILDEEFLR